MYWQQQMLTEGKAFSSLSGMTTVELPNRGLLGGIDLHVWGTCGTGAADPDVWLHDRLTRIEIVINGSEIVKSYSGEQLLGLMHYKKTPIFPHCGKNMSGASCDEFFHINFGRFFHDTEYLLDLGKVNDPEIRFTHNFSSTSANGWTNGTAMTVIPTFTLIPHVLRDGPTESSGYIKTSELYRFTSGVSKKENMMIPRGPTYSNLYLQSWYVAQGIGYLLDKIELNLNMSEVIPFRLGPNDLIVQNLRQYGLCKIVQQFTATGGQAYPTPIEQGVSYNARIGLIAEISSAVDVWGNASPIAFREMDGLTPSTSAVNIQQVFEGCWPFSLAALPNFNPEDLRTWLDTSRYGDVMVRVEENASGGTSATLKLLGDEVVRSYR